MTLDYPFSHRDMRIVPLIVLKFCAGKVFSHFGWTDGLYVAGEWWGWETFCRIRLEVPKRPGGGGGFLVKCPT